MTAALLYLAWIGMAFVLGIAWAALYGVLCLGLSLLHGRHLDRSGGAR